MTTCESFRPTPVALLLALLLVQAVAVADLTWPTTDDHSIEAQVARWALEQGAEINGVRVGRQCPTCIRGVLATRTIHPDEVLLKVPVSTMLRFESNLDATSENARELLVRMHTEPTFNATFGMFLQAHPPPEDMFTPDLYEPEHIAMLQTPELEELVRWHRETTQEVYNGTYEAVSYNVSYKPLYQELPHVTWEMFRHTTALLHSRSFSLTLEGKNQTISALIPVIDMTNHSDEPNTWWYIENDEAIVLKARETIEEGQEIRHNYIHDLMNRHDMSMFFFGFVLPTEQPCLAAVDLPTYDPNNAYAGTPQTDEIYDDPDSEYVSEEEYERLYQRLEAVPTTEEQDQDALDSGMVTDWRLRSILEYRILRKRALRLTLEKIWGHLHPEEQGTDDAAGEEGEGEQQAGGEGADEAGEGAACTPGQDGCSLDAVGSTDADHPAADTAIDQELDMRNEHSEL